MTQDTEVRDQVLIFLLGGHDTTALAPRITLHPAAPVPCRLTAR